MLFSHEYSVIVWWVCKVETYITSESNGKKESSIMLCQILNRYMYDIRYILLVKVCLLVYNIIVAK